MQETYGQTLNQQATDVELAWLAGYLDGEGTFQVVRRKDKREGQHQANIQVSNTDPVLVAKSFYLFEKMGVHPHVSNFQPGNANHREHWIVTVGKLEDIKKACLLLLPFLVGKRARAELLLGYSESRLRHGSGRGGTKPYSESDLTIVEELKKLNHRGAPETARTAPVIRVKIQSGLNGDIQRMAETTIPRAGESHSW